MLSKNKITQTWISQSIQTTYKVIWISIFYVVSVANLGSPQMPEANSQRREIGDLAVWTLSSAKPGNGVEQIRDDSISTFWQYLFLTIK